MLLVRPFQTSYGFQPSYWLPLVARVQYRMVHLQLGMLLQARLSLYHEAGLEGPSRALKRSPFGGHSVGEVSLTVTIIQVVHLCAPVHRQATAVGLVAG